MLRDMARQPRVMAGLLDRTGEFLALGRDLLAPRPGGRLFVCGCGDGVFAARAAAGWAADAGLDWRPVGALDLLLQAGRLSGADRVVAVSMSGNVDRTVEAAQAAVAQGVPLLALVNGGGGRLGAVAGSMVSLDVPDEAPFLCGTTSYTATVMALVLLAAGAGQPGMVDRLGAAVGMSEAALLAAEAVILPPGWLPTGVRVLAAGPEMGTAFYGAAKLVELTRVPAWAADLEEFAHSQYWAMPATDLVVVVATEPALARFATETCAALRQLGVVTMGIDTPQSPVLTATVRVTLPVTEPSLAPLASALPLQWLAHQLAVRTGLDPDTRVHLKADEPRFRVSRLLTRRVLAGTGH